MKVKIKDKKDLLKTHFMNISEYTLEQEIDNRTTEYKRQCLHRGDAVFIVPYDKERNSVVMVEQTRIGSIIGGTGSTTLEFPAGIIDEGEEPIETAKRELFEETGLEAKNIEQLYKSVIYPSVGGSDEKLTYFLAEVDSSKVLEKTGEDKENEYIETKVIPFDELVKMVLEDQSINVVNTLSTVLLLREKLNN